MWKWLKPVDKMQLLNLIEIQKYLLSSNPPDHINFQPPRTLQNTHDTLEAA